MDEERDRRSKSSSDDVEAMHGRGCGDKAGDGREAISVAEMLSDCGWWECCGRERFE